MQRADSPEKTLMLEKTEGRRRRGWQRMRWLDCITNSTATNLRKRWARVEDREPAWAVIHGTPRSRARLSNWATIQDPVRQECNPTLPALVDLSTALIVSTFYFIKQFFSSRFSKLRTLWFFVTSLATPLFSLFYHFPPFSLKISESHKNWD